MVIFKGVGGWLDGESENVPRFRSIRSFLCCNLVSPVVFVVLAFGHLFARTQVFVVMGLPG